MKKNKKLKKTTEPLFFLFTCVKDGRKYIEKLFKSLLSQTKINFVHYIYEDGSSEPLGNIIDEYKEKVKSLKTPYKVYYERCLTNIGLNKSTEHCIKKCNLKYFIWINCDDWLDKNFFKNAEKYVAKHPKVSVFRSHMMVHKNGVNYFEQKNMSEIKKMFLEKQRDLYIVNNFYFNHFIVKKDDYLNVNKSVEFMFDRNIYNDVQVLVPLILENYSFCFMKKSISHFFIHSDSEFFSVENNASLYKLTEFLNLNKDNIYLDFKAKILDINNNIEISKKEKKYKQQLHFLNVREKLYKEHSDLFNNLRKISKTKFYWKFYVFLRKLFRI